MEFAVNDTVNPDVEASYEALVRQCVESSGKPLVILIFTMRRDGTNLQERHIPIGMHYALPMLSYRDALYPEVCAGNLAWETISPDEVHPNDRGHALIASMLKRFIDTVDAPDGSRELPAMLYPDAVKYLAGRVVDAERMDVLENRGWTQYDHGRGYRGWESETPGSVLKVNVTGGKILTGYVKYAGDFGMAGVKVDGTDVGKLDGFYEKPEIQKWAGGQTVLEPLIDDVPETEHVVEITLLKERHSKSNGSRFKISYFLAGK